MNILKKRSRRYTAASTAFTVVVIALVILLNTVFTMLATRFSLYADLTDTSLWTLSDAAKEVVSKADGDITITFCHDRDYITASSTLQYVSRTAEELSKVFPNITVRYINSILEPQLVEKYKYNAADTVKTTSVIIESGTEFRKYSPDAFFVTDSDGSVWAYNGEEIFAAGCLAVTAAEHPIAYFTTGHGEVAPAAFINTIVKAGYDVKTIDLTTDEISEDCRLIIVNSPLYDFAGYNVYDKDAVSEIAKLDKFLDGNGTLMVFKAPETEYLKNLEEYLYEWGVVFGEGVVEDTAHSITPDGRALVAEYPTGTLAASIHKDISSLTSPPKTVVKNASPITVAPLYTAGVGEDNSVKTNTWEYSGNTAYREISAVLTAKSTAKTVNAGVTTDTAGGYNLMTVTRELNTLDNDEYYSYVLAAGTEYFTTPDYLESNVYGNKNILYYALRVMGREKVPADIQFKEFASYKIENMTSAEATRDTVLLVTVIPVIIALCGVVVTTRRRFK